MLMAIWFIAQFALVLATVMVGPHLPQSPLEMVVWVLITAAFLAVTVPAFGRLLVRALSSAPLATPPMSVRRQPVTFRLPAAPGTPGTLRARAPSALVHASA